MKRENLWDLMSEDAINDALGLCEKKRIFSFS